MAAQTLTSIPSIMTAGETLLFKIDLENFPADQDWVLTYSFRAKEATAIDISGTESGASHLFNVPKATTATWIPAKYNGIAKITDGVETFTIWRGYLEVLPDLSQQDANYDTRSHAQKCLDSINAVLEGKASRDVLSSTIAGQSISRMSFSELLSAKAHYENLVKGEKDDAAGISRRNVLVRFGNA
jgi:hypothetical protein